MVYGRHFPNTIGSFFKWTRILGFGQHMGEDYGMEEISKKTKRMLGSMDEMVIFRRITERITLNGENVV